MRGLIVLICVALLSGCVTYTDDKGRDCVVNLDPLTNLVTLIQAPVTGEVGVKTCSDKGEHAKE